MEIARRQFLGCAACAVSWSIASRIAEAQHYPSRPVRLIVGFPAGGQIDTVARLMAQWLSSRLGQPVVIENRPGAAGNIATEAVVRAAADGHTLLLAASANAINASLYDRLNFDFIKDITPIGSISRNPLVVVISPSVPVHTVSEFIAYAKSNPDKLTMASASKGTPHHVSGELFKMMTGVKMLHVPYRGEAPALTDVVGGQVKAMFTPTGGTIEYIRSSKVRALGVTTAERLDILPDTPTVDATVPGYEASGWFGLVAPKNTPGDIVARLNNEINAGLADTTIKARFAGLGAIVFPGSPSDFSALIAREFHKWREVVTFAGIRPD